MTSGSELGNDSSVRQIVPAVLICDLIYGGEPLPNLQHIAKSIWLLTNAPPDKWGGGNRLKTFASLLLQNPFLPQDSQMFSWHLWHWMWGRLNCSLFRVIWSLIMFSSLVQIRHFIHKWYYLYIVYTMFFFLKYFCWMFV